MKIRIFIVVLFLVLLLVVFRRKETFEGQKICLLLVCCVHTRQNNDEIRIKWYTDAINKYLETTNLQVRVVESSGYKFPIEHERLKQYAFTSTLDKGIGFPTRGEAESILKVNESGILDDFDTIIKVTGKYYLPELEEEINNIPGNAGIIYQNIKDDSLKSNNSEIFGFRREYTNDIFDEHLKFPSKYIDLESGIYNVHERLGCNYHTFKTIKVECTDECPYRNNGSKLAEL